MLEQRILAAEEHADFLEKQDEIDQEYLAEVRERIAGMRKMLIPR